MRAWLVLVTLALAPRLAHAIDDPGALEAERVRLSEELTMMASRNAWKGVEANYVKLEELEKKGVPLVFDDHYYGAQAARSLGHVSDAYARLKKAQDLRHTPEVDQWVSEIEASYGPVDLYVDPRYRDAFGLVIAEMPFDPEQRGAVETAQTTVAETRAYRGILPKGLYTLGDQSFEVAAEPVTIELTGKGQLSGDAVVSAGETDDTLSYVGPRAALGVGFTSVGDSAARTLQPRGFLGESLRLGVGVELGFAKNLGGFVEAGYHGTLGAPVDGSGERLEAKDSVELRPNMLHLGYGWIGVVIRANDLALSLGPTVGIGGGGITGVDDGCSTDCGGLEHADDDALAYQRLSGSVRAVGATVGALYQLMPLGNLRGGLALYAGAYDDGSRLYPWATLAYAIAPPTPRRH